MQDQEAENKDGDAGDDSVSARRLQGQTVDVQVLIDYREEIATIIDRLAQTYDRMPYRTSEDKRRQNRVREQMGNYWQKLDAIAGIARRGGVKLPRRPVRVIGQSKLDTKWKV